MQGGSLPRNSAQLMFVLSINPGCYWMKYCTTTLKDWLECSIREKKKKRKKTLKNNNFQWSEIILSGTAQRLWFTITSQTGAFHRQWALHCAEITNDSKEAHFLRTASKPFPWSSVLLLKCATRRPTKTDSRWFVESRELAHVHNAGD